MKNMRKVLLPAALLCLVLILVLSAPASAEGEEENNRSVGNYTALKNVLADEEYVGTVTLTSNTTLPATSGQLNYFPVKGTVTLALNGKTINCNSSSSAKIKTVFGIEDGGSLTITGSGRIEGKANNPAIIVNEGGSLTVKSGTIASSISVCDIVELDRAAVYVEGSLCIEGGRITTSEGEGLPLGDREAPHMEARQNNIIRRGRYADPDRAGNHADDRSGRTAGIG